VARQTRSERRALRAAQAESKAAVERSSRTRPQLRPAVEPAHAQEQPRRRGPFAGTRNFIAESWAELKKVEWPGQQQLISGTAVVIIASLITGVYLYLNDQVWQWVVQHLFLR
jgi:preprotein translocase subunit SecE